MKRIIILLTCICLCFTCVACGNTDIQEPTQNDATDTMPETTASNESNEDISSESQNTEENTANDSVATTELTWDAYENYESFKNDEMNKVAIPVPNSSFTTEYKGAGRIGFYTDAEGNEYKIMIAAQDEETETVSEDVLDLYLEQFNTIEQHYYDFYFHRLHIIRLRDTQTINGREFQCFKVNHTFFVEEEDIIEEYCTIYVTKTSNGAYIMWLVATQVPDDSTSNEMVESMAKIMAEGLQEVE